jgi:hypothetical protein
MSEVKRYCVPEHEVMDIPDGGILARIDGYIEMIAASDYDALASECDMLARLVDDLEMRLRQLYLEQQGCLRGR